MSSILLALVVNVAGTTPVTADDTVAIPNLWDSRRKFDPPNLGSQRQIRFITESDYPPFHFVTPSGQLSGFEVDLARGLCDLLKVSCSIQAVRWDGLKDALMTGQGDAIIAAMRITPEARKTFGFTTAYFRSPARFVVQRADPLVEPTLEQLSGKRVAVMGQSAHEAYMRTFFPDVGRMVTQNASEALAAVRAGEVAAAFVDGTVAAFWLNGEQSGNCCRFLGGGFTEARFFGEGAGIAVRPDAQALRQALDWALHRFAAEGGYARLYLKYFPVSIY
ncbi:MAG TPA: transporter substrate-binding domain-containing protein [Beijerinckiaceae bacterium]|nr:transporter substrate-binding domain-containing protein [Beijerinckiaceae bacterium]